MRAGGGMEDERAASRLAGGVSSVAGHARAATTEAAHQRTSVRDTSV